MELALLHSENFPKWIADRKEYFRAKTEQGMKVNDQLISAFERCSETIGIWHNKVINKRIEMSLRSLEIPNITFQLATVGFVNTKHILHIRCDDNTFSYTDTEGKTQWGGFVDRCDMLIELAEIDCGQKNKRLDYPKTKENIETAIRRLRESNETLRDCVDNFDKYILMGVDISEAVKRYEASVPEPLRLIIGITRWNTF